MLEQASIVIKRLMIIVLITGFITRTVMSSKLTGFVEAVKR
jgi:hypothetical protein